MPELCGNTTVPRTAESPYIVGLAASGIFKTNKSEFTEIE